MGIYCATPQKSRRPQLHKTFYVYLHLRVPNNKKEKKKPCDPVRTVPELGNFENRIGCFTSEKVYAFFSILFRFRAVPSFFLCPFFFSLSGLACSSLLVVHIFAKLIYFLAVENVPRDDSKTGDEIKVFYEETLSGHAVLRAFLRSSITQDSWLSRWFIITGQWSTKLQNSSNVQDVQNYRDSASLSIDRCCN